MVGIERFFHQRHNNPYAVRWDNRLSAKYFDKD